MRQLKVVEVNSEKIGETVLRILRIVSTVSIFFLASECLQGSSCFMIYLAHSCTSLPVMLNENKVSLMDPKFSVDLGQTFKIEFRAFIEC